MSQRGSGKPAQARHLRRVVHLLQAAIDGIFQHARPDRLAFADSDGIAMPRRFLRVKPDVRPAHDHRNALPAKFVGNVVGSNGMDRPSGDGHHVWLRLAVEVDVLNLFVDQRDVPALPALAPPNKAE